MAAYIKFDGVDGEAMDKDHQKWSDILSFTQGIHKPGGGATGATRRRGDVVLDDLLVVKEIDKASTKIAESVLKGKVFPKVDIHVSRALSDGTRITYYVYELKNAVVTSYRVQGSTKDDMPLEDVSVNFEQIKVTYTEFDDYGGSESIVMYGWDVVRNQPQ